MEEFVHNTFSYLEQYYLRNNSESGLSAEKDGLGGKWDKKGRIELRPL